MPVTTHNFTDTPREHIYRAENINDLYYFVNCLDPLQVIIIRSRPDGLFVWLESDVQDCDYLFQWKFLAGSFVSKFFKFS